MLRPGRMPERTPEEAMERSETAPGYRRILLKLSGEAFSGGADFGIDTSVATKVAKQIKQVTETGVSIAVVVGGGNIWRGAEAERAGMDRATADYAGMLATVINALSLQDALEREGVTTRTQSSCSARHRSRKV